MGVVFILRDEIKNIVRVACIYMATVVGAGFASGQEIVRFFSIYYKGGFYGIVLAGLMFALIGSLVLDKVYRGRIRNYDELVFPMIGWTLGWIMQIIVTIFMLCLFCVMLAGMGNIIVDRFNISYNYAVILMAILCMIIMLSDIKGIITLSTLVTPVLIIGIIATGLYIIISQDTAAANINFLFGYLTKNWFFSSLLYVGYNSILSMVVLSSLLPYLTTRRVGIVGGAIGGLLLCLTVMIINSAIFIFYPGILSDELPVLAMVERYSGAMSMAYTFILWLAMFVSAVTSGYYFVERMSSKTNVNIKIMAIVTCAVVIPLSGYGFSNIISTVYPLFGYAGLFLVIVIVVNWVKTFLQHL